MEIVGIDLKIPFFFLILIGKSIKFFALRMQLMLSVYQKIFWREDQSFALSIHSSFSTVKTQVGFVEMTDKFKQGIF